MKKIIILLCLGFVVSQSALAQQKEFHWLIGTWKLKDKNAYEVWSVADDDKTLVAKAYRIKLQDTTITEEIRLTYDQQSFFYTPDIAGPQGPVPFKITQHGTQSFVAENPLHDFPKIIRYTLRRENNRDYIDAAIEADGKVISYSFERLR
ncbi:MAG: hypothetical protein ACOYXT_27835 [Bacteroidota bacterium]